MCGISGVFDLAGNIDGSLIKKMTDAIAHRGPDGEGQWINTNQTVALGHRRLSIIDLSEDGKQPMHWEEGRYSITFNGEIYNYIEIREQLLKKGIKFKSQSDTEVLLALYALKGPECLQELDGMFAIVIWDAKEKTLFCARDRFGEKPFFYHHSPGKKFVFASEMKALWAYGIPKEVNQRMMYNFCNNMFMLGNPENKPETFYNNISKLEPAHYLILDEKLNLVKKRYWDVDLKKIDRSITEEQAIDSFRSMFENSTRLRLRSDVPVGSSLSGGLDSSTIVCLIDKINADSKIVQKTFSARFKDFAKDEGKYMEMVANRTKVEPHYTWPDENDLINDLDKLFYHQEEPFGTASIMAQWSVMKLARENNVTVLLDGQGADEILAGYHYYFHTFLKEMYHTNRPLHDKELAAYRAAYNPEYNAAYIPVQKPTTTPTLSKIKNKAKDLVRPMYRAIIPAKPQVFVNPTSTDTVYEEKQEPFLDQGFIDAHANGIFKTNFEESLNGQLYFNTCVLGLEDLLRFSDRNSMAFSREVRLPFLNHQLVEFLFSLPPSMKINNSWTKNILRKSFEDILPPEIAWRRDKIGYEPPQKKWLGSPVIKEWISASKEKLEKEHIINPKRNKEQDNDWLCLMTSKLIS